MTSFNLDHYSWWGFLEEDLQELLNEATLLVKRVGEWDEHFHDYSFVVFPAAKAYEGFLKKLFLGMGFITKDDYFGKYFRIGKSLNPVLPKRFRDDDWVYDDLVTYCKGNELADFLWNTWKNCRNLTFHWFPNKKNAITFEEAVVKVKRIVKAIDKAFSQCKIS